MPLHLPAICIVTRVRGRAGGGERAALLDRLATGARAGATMIQVRERQIDDRSLLEFLEQVTKAVRPAGTAVMVNDRADVALAAGADGVHLKSDAPPAEEVRRLAPGGFLIGRSVHSEDEAATAAASGACDYLVFGTVFRSSSKPDDHPVAGLEALRAVCRRVNIPVLAIGGIAANRVADVAAGGAAGVAAISLFAEAAAIETTVHALRASLTVPSRRV